MINRFIAVSLFYLLSTKTVYAWKPGQPLTKLATDTWHDVNNGPAGDLTRGFEHLGKEITGVNAKNRTKESRRNAQKEQLKSDLKSSMMTNKDKKNIIDLQIVQLSTEVLENQKLLESLKQDNILLENVLNKKNQLNIKLETLVSLKSQITATLPDLGEENQSPFSIWSDLIKNHKPELYALAETDSISYETIIFLEEFFKSYNTLKDLNAAVRDEFNSLISAFESEDLAVEVDKTFSTLESIYLKNNTTISEIEKEIKQKNSQIEVLKSSSQTLQSLISELNNRLSQI